jgi:TolB-like protein/class 3 adenylate cyclase
LASKRLDRRLSAVLAADVAGYSRLVGADEEGTIGRLRAHRATLFDPKLAEHRGRLVKTTGDGLLAEFASVVDAVRCAVEVQRGMVARNADIAPDRRIEFRIGIHVGDIIIEDDDIFGDGVNVAARLEGLAAPGGICVSARVQEDVEGRIDVDFADEGEQQLKNIARPVRVYRVRLGGVEAEEATPPDAKPETPAGLAVPDMPSIAVLPFQNMSTDPEQEFFADGMVEDIITGLSRYRHLFVIARNSTFTYKGRAVDMKQVGRELGVRYLLEGSVRRAGSRIRITAQLIDTATAAHIWAERFEGGIEDMFDLQDQVTAKVVGAIEPEMRRAETERARRRPTDNPDAHLCLMRGLMSLNKWNKPGIDEALRLAYQAIELDPGYSAPYGLAVSCYVIRRANRWTTDPAHDRSETARLTARAVEVGREDAVTLSLSGFAIAAVLGDLDVGVALIDRALALTPNFGMVLAHSGYVRVWLGETEAAIDYLQRAMRLSPVDPLIFLMQAALAMAHFIAGRDDEAFAWSEKSTQRNPFFPAATWTAAASAANLGRTEDAAKHVARLRQIDPGVTIPTIEERLNLRRPQDRARLIDALRKAGLAE